MEGRKLNVRGGSVGIVAVSSLFGSAVCTCELAMERNAVAEEE